MAALTRTVDTLDLGELVAIRPDADAVVASARRGRQWRRARKLDDRTTRAINHAVGRMDLPAVAAAIADCLQLIEVLEGRDGLQKLESNEDDMRELLSTLGQVLAGVWTISGVLDEAADNGFIVPAELYATYPGSG